MTKIHIEIEDKVVELTPEQARTLYGELGKLFATSAVSIPSIWTAPGLQPLHAVTVGSTTPDWIPGCREIPA